MLTIEQIPEVKRKIGVLQERRARAEGGKETIRKRWKDEFNCDSVEAAREAKERKVQEREELLRRLTVLLEKIEKAYDWESV
jgi:hypothetical protein